MINTTERHFQHKFYHIGWPCLLCNAKPCECKDGKNAIFVTNWRTDNPLHIFFFIFSPHFCHVEEKNKIQGRLETRPPLPGQNKRIRPAATALEVRIHMNIHDTWLAYLDFYCVFVCEDQCLGGSNPTEQGGSLLADGSNQGWLPDTFQVGGCAFLKHLKESHIHTHTKKHKYTQISGVIICNAGFWSPSPGLSLWESHQQGTQVIFKHKNTHRLYSNTKTLRSISLSSLTLGGKAWQRGCCEAYSWNSEACSRHQIEVVFFIALLQFSAPFYC